MAVVKLNEIAKRLGNPSLQGRMNGTMLSLQFLPDAYDAAKCRSKEAGLVDPGSYKSAMARFATGNLQSNKNNRGHTELTQSLLDNLSSKANSFTCRDGTVRSYYESMREKIGRLVTDPNHFPLTAESSVWELTDTLHTSPEPVFRNIADAITKKKNAGELTDALFLLTLAAIFTRPKDLVQLSHLWTEAMSPPGQPRPEPAGESVGATAQGRSLAVPEVEFRLNPPVVDDYIDGYQEEAEQILKALQEPGGRNKVALSGMSGIGKSSLAAAIAHRYQMDGKKVLWMDFKGNLRDTLCDDRNLSIRGLYHVNYWKTPDDYFQIKLEILQRQAGPDTLIVFDGINRTDKGLEQLLRGEYPVLITTQHEQLDHRLTPVRLEHFPDASRRLELFCRKYGRDITGTDLEMVLKLLERWQYHTYAICLLAEAMRANPTILENIRAASQTGSHLSEKDPMAVICPGLYEAVLTKSFDEDTFPQVLYILRNLALLPESGIPRALFGQWIGFGEKQAEWTCLQTLTDRRLVLQDRCTDTIHLHGLVAALVMQDPGDGTWCSGMTEALFAACERAPESSCEEKMQLLEQVRAVYARTADLEGGCFPTIHRNAGICLGGLLELLARYEESAGVFRSLQERAQDGVMRAFLRAREAQNYIRAGNLEDGWKCAWEEYERIRPLTGAAPTEPLRRVYSRLCQSLCECARCFRAYAESAMYGREADGCAYEAQSVRELGWAYYQLGCTLYVQGELPESTVCIEQAAGQFEVIGEEYPQIYTEEMRSQMDMTDGRMEEALKHICQSREILLRCVGDRHVDYGRNLLYEGNICRMAGDEEAAEKAYAEAARLFADLGCFARSDAAEQALLEHCIILDVWPQDFVAVDADKIRAERDGLCDCVGEMPPEVLGSV